MNVSTYYTPKNQQLPAAIARALYGHGEYAWMPGYYIPSAESGAIEFFPVLGL